MIQSSPYASSLLQMQSIPFFSSYFSNFSECPADVPNIVLYPIRTFLFEAMIYSDCFDPTFKMVLGKRYYQQEPKLFCLV